MSSYVHTRLALVLCCSVALASACISGGGGGAASNSGAAGPSATSGKASSGPEETWLVENFESSTGLSGMVNLEYDKNNIGTVVETAPFKAAPEGSPQSPSGSGRVKGTLGANRAPWSWVQLQLFLDKASSAKDISKFKSLRFMVKGNGGRYNVGLIKKAVSDFDHFVFTFQAPPTWTEVRIPLGDFRQAGWGKKVNAVFDDVTMIQFSPAENEKPFEFFVDDVTLSTSEAVLQPVPYDTKGWFEYAGTDVSKRRGTALDVSRLLDAPAGKHGFVTRRGDGLAFKDGTPARFIGVNIVASANFPTHAEAERLAELLAQLGVNLTRHHHMDADWSRPNLFGNKPSTLELDPEALERFDYLVAQLQKRGIYQFMDLIVHRKALPADGIPSPEDVTPGYKIEGEFSPKLIELQEKFTTQLFGHQNPYTKKKYGADPAIAMLEVINEDSLFFLQKEGDFAITSPHYKDELGRLFDAWLRKKYGSYAELQKAWEGGVLRGEDPVKGGVNAVMTFNDESYKRLSKPRAADTMRFYRDTMLAYFRRMEGLVRRLGYQGLVAGSNHWVDLPLDLKMNAELGYVDRHSYWSHPQGGWGYDTGVSFDPSPMVKDVNLGIVGTLLQRRVAGLPYTVSEWQTSAPNDYRAEGLLVMSAISSYQGWHPLQFSFSHDIANKAEEAPKLASNFDVIHQPNLLSLWPAMALMFHRADVKEAATQAYLAVDDQTLHDPAQRLRLIKQSPLVFKGGVDFTAGKPAAELDKLVQPQVKGTRVTAPGGQLAHDATAGTFEVDTPRTQGFAGFKSARKLSLTNLELALDSGFAVVVLSALTDEPIASAKRLLLTAAGNAVNTGMKLEPSRGRLADPGKAPILTETIRGQVTLKLGGALDRVKVYALGPSGERLKEVAAQKAAGALSFALEPAHHTLSYEIVRE
jgi:hypothetical protein